MAAIAIVVVTYNSEACVGDLLDSKYRIVRWLGGGGWGDVYLAKDELLGSHVAIKLLHDRNSNH